MIVSETNRNGEAVCEISDLPRLMCAHCSGKVAEVEVIGTYTPPSGDPVRLVRADLSGYRTLPYYPPAPPQASNVSGRTCRCGAPCGDAFICSSCADDLDRCLGDVPALVEDLDIAAARLDRVRSWPRLPRPRDAASLLEKPVADWTFDDSDQPLHEEIRTRSLRILGRGRPDNPGASSARDQLTRVLVTAVAVVEPTMAGPFDPVATSRWLLGRMRRIITHPEAGSIAEQVIGAHDRCMRIVDSAPDRTFYGNCTGDAGDDVECGEPILVPEGAVVWDCVVCGARYDVAAMQAERIDRARDSILSVRELAAVVDKTERAVRNIIRRRGITPVGSRLEGGKQVEVYRGADYLDASTGVPTSVVR